MQADRLDGCPSTSFLTLLICLQYRGNDFGGGDVSRDVFHEPRGRVDLLRVVFFLAVKYTKRNKKNIRGHKCLRYDQQ